MSKIYLFYTVSPHDPFDESSDPTHVKHELSQNQQK